MAEVFFSAVVGDMVGRVISLLAGKFKCQRCTEAKLRRICHMLIKVHSAVEEAKGRQITNYGTLEWLSELNDGVYKGRYLLDTVECTVQELEDEHADKAPLTVHDPDFEGIVDFEDDELLCFHNMKPMKFVAFEGALTGRRFYGCGQEVGTCAFVSWVDEEWPDSLKNALHKLWDLYHDCKSARVQAGLDHAEQVLKLEDKIKQSDIQYSNLVKDVHQIIDQQMKQCYNENYNEIMTGDEAGMKKELDRKTYAIQDLKAIHVAQGEVITNMRKERDGLKKEKTELAFARDQVMKHADGLKAELGDMYNVVQERDDLKKAMDELKKERDGLKKEKKRLEYGIADLLKLGDVNKTKLKNIKMICEDEATVIEFSG